MAAKHINKYDFSTQGVLASNTINNAANKINMERKGNKEEEAVDDSKRKGTETERTTEEILVKTVETSTDFQYPPAWKNTLPKFPFVPRAEEVSRAPVESQPTEPSVVATGWEDGQMPVFPFSSSAGKKTTPQKYKYIYNDWL